MCVCAVPISVILHSAIFSSNNMSKNWVGIAISNAVFGCVFFLLALPTALWYVALQLKLWIATIGLRLTSPTEAKYSHFQNGRMVEVESVSTESALDFKRHRSSTYIPQVTFGCLWEFCKFVSGTQDVPLIADHMLRHVILNTVFSDGLIKGDPDSDIEWRLPFHLEKYHVYKGYYWDVTEIRLHPEYKISIVDRSGRVHKPNNCTWDLAKAHAQAQLTFFAPGLAHNHVHFVFPSLMASKIRTALPKDSVLRQLLEPHTRFTEFINHEALYECKSSSNTGSLADRIFRPWLSFPVSNDDFLKGIKDKCENFYYDEMTLIPELHEELPYHSFLRSYYKVVHSFVASIEPLITDDYITLTSSLKEYLPSLEERKAVDVVSTLLWNCAIVHFCDHQGFLRLFADKYGCTSIRAPLVPVDYVASEGKPLFTAINTYITSPKLDVTRGSFFASEDIYRTRCFQKVFVRYNGNKNMDLSLPSTIYEFTDKLAIEAAKTFFSDLDELDNKLRQRGEAIVPLSTFVRTVCF